MNPIRYMPFALLVACSGGFSEKTVEVIPTEEQLFAKYCPASGMIDKIPSTQPLKIVAIGSSTTEGVGATDPKWNYVSRLRTRLEIEFPGRSIEVINAGRGGENIFMIDGRYGRDVMTANPDIVILQTGINDALQKVDRERFSQVLSGIVEMTKEANISMVLMGNQYLGDNELERVPALMEFEGVIHKVALSNSITMINRHDLFKNLIKYNYWTVSQLYGGDFLHFSDLGYEKLERCVRLSL